MKREIRILGIDDGPFEKAQPAKILVVGAFFRGGQFMDGLVATSVTRDGFDATDKIAAMITQSKFHAQLQALMLKGVAVGGFNVIDIEEVRAATGLPILVVMREPPEFPRFYAAMKQAGHESDIPLVQGWPAPKKVDSVHVQLFGLSIKEAMGLLRLTCLHGHIPEPLRVAHLIAGGLVSGQSRGRA